MIIPPPPCFLLNTTASGSRNDLPCKWRYHLPVAMGDPSLPASVMLPMFLKTAVVGLNNKSLPLTPMQHPVATKYREIVSLKCF